MAGPRSRCWIRQARRSSLLSRPVPSTGFNWNYGVLPPGNYRLRVRVGAAEAIQAFSINNPPAIRVTDPSRVTGEDYATSVLGNPWDMDGPEDVQLAASGGITNVSFDGEMHATNTNADPNVPFLHYQQRDPD